MKSKLYLLTAIAIAVILLVGISQVKPQKSYSNEDDMFLIISEVVSSNKSIIADAYGNYSDYIEIHNTGDHSIPLKGYGLSDDAALPLKWSFPDIRIPSKGYVVVFASGMKQSENNLHTNFTLNQYGELIVLSDPNGTIIQELLIPRMISNMAYGLDLENPGQYVFYTTATPGGVNKGNIIQDVAAYINDINVQYSQEAGIYTENFLLELSTKRPDALIYYTIDGNNPETTDYLYTEPLLIDSRVGATPLYGTLSDFTFSTIYPRSMNVKDEAIYMATVIKAQAYIDSVPYGEVLTKTYFVDELGSARYTFPIISLTADPDVFFDKEQGIYTVGTQFKLTAPPNPDGETPANYNQRGIDWERPVHLEYFDTQGILQFQQNLGARIFGGWSRMYPKKSLKLYPRKAYDNSNTLDYPFFTNLLNIEGKPIETFSNLVIRNSGNDWEYTCFRDVMMTALVSDLVDVQAYQPVILFINGEYWGIYNLREIVNAEYIESRYDVDKKDLTMIALTNGIEVYEGEEEDIEDYNAFYDYVDTHDLSDDLHYQHVINQIDVDNYLNYYVSQLFYNNTDWPGNNVKLWRKDIEGVDNTAPIGHDGKWRYVLYDTDFGFGLYEGTSSINSLINATTPYGSDWPNPPESTLVFRKLLENENFRELFVTRTTDLLNTRFSPANLSETIDYYVDLYKPEIEENINRWLPDNSQTLDRWESNVDVLYNFANDRDRIFRGYVRSYFGLETPTNVTIEASTGGYVRINNFIDVAENEISFKGKYFPEFTITLEAIALEGYTFAGWSGDVKGDSMVIEVNPKDGMMIIANYN